VEDSHQPVGELAQSRVMTYVACSQLVVVGAGTW
jgi:hypothetical protein